MNQLERALPARSSIAVREDSLRWDISRYNNGHLSV
jgi:hypothetical protein